MIAGFDPSLTHFGWVIFDEHKTDKESVLEAGVFKTSPEDGLLIQRLLMQKERIRLLLTSRNIKFVTMEAPYWGDFNTEILFALNQQIHELFLDLKMFVVYVQPQSLKKVALPDMKLNDVTKHHITHQAKKELDMSGKRFSEHVADAYFAGKIGHRFYKWFILHELQDHDLSEYEQDLFCGKHTFVKGVKKGTTEYTGLIYKENDQFFDYSKQARNSKIIAEEVTNGGKDFKSGRIL